MILIIFNILLLSHPSEMLHSNIRTYSREESNKIININKISDACQNCSVSEEATLYTAEIGTNKNTNYSYKVDTPIILIEAKIPNDIKLRSNEKIDNLYDSKDKIKLYELIYKNNNNQRKIKIIYSDNAVVINNYILPESNKVSKIKSTELYIYNFKNSYRAIFKYKNTFFRIESEGITEEEFTTLLKSIIKE